MRILSIAVKKSCKGKGIGSLLLNSFERQLRQSGIKKYGLSVRKQNMPAINFYVSSGFKVYKESDTCFTIIKKYKNLKMVIDLRSNFYLFTSYISRESDEVVIRILGLDYDRIKTKRFESEFASFIRAVCVALNSCTAGLHLALVVLGIGSGDGDHNTMTFVQQ